MNVVVSPYEGTDRSPEELWFSVFWTVVQTIFGPDMLSNRRKNFFCFPIMIIDADKHRDKNNGENVEWLLYMTSYSYLLKFFK